MNLPDALLEDVRAYARAENTTVTSVVEEALRRLLEQPSVRRPRPMLPTDGLPDGRMLVDLDDKEAVAAELDRDGWR